MIPDRKSDPAADLPAELRIPPSPTRVSEALALATEAEKHAFKVLREGQLWNEAQAARCLQDCAKALRDLAR